MSIRIINVVLCDAIRGDQRYTLTGVGSRWPRPPRNVGVWVELANLSEREFSISVQVWRGHELVAESETELVLAGKAYWQSKFLFGNTSELERKSYQFAVLIDKQSRHTMVGDFGVVES